MTRACVLEAFVGAINTDDDQCTTVLDTAIIATSRNYFPIGKFHNGGQPNDSGGEQRENFYVVLFSAIS